MTLATELDRPNYFNVFTWDVVLPYLLYFWLFRTSSRWVKEHLWLEFQGFKRYRLQNLTVCAGHAVIVGIGAVVGLLYNYDNISDLVVYYDHLLAQIPIISMAYFTHDAVDMLGQEWNSYVIELLFHHVLTIFCLAMPFPARRFIIGSLWALLMETNSIFLHLRTIMQISGRSKTHPNVYNIVSKLNIATFVLFRFFAQMFLIFCSFKDPMHIFYKCLTICAGSVFIIVNIFLLLRILATDGYLPPRLAHRFNTNRDNEKKE